MLGFINKTNVGCVSERSSRNAPLLHLFGALRFANTPYLYIFLLCLFSFQISYASITVTDDNHQPITLNKPATRIISLAPNLTEILFAIGAGNKLVGVSTDSNYPKAAKKITIVSNASELNLEKIIALKPDLIIAWQGGNPSRELDKLIQLKIPVYMTNPKTINDIPKTMVNLGKLTHHQNQAKNLARQFQDKIQQLKQQYAHQKKIKVFYEIWQTPIFTVSKDSLISQVINLCGGSNVFANTLGLAPEVSFEAVIAANPQVIIGGYQHKNWQSFWQKWPQIQAVKNKQLYSIDPDLLQRYGPRLAQGAAKVCADLAKARWVLS